MRLDWSPSPHITQLFLLRPHRHLGHIPAKKILHLFRTEYTGQTGGPAGFQYHIGSAEAPSCF